MIILICGFGRCGSSLCMQMLAAGGMPVVGEFPAFEECLQLPSGTRALESLRGHAVKLLDPHRGPIPRGPRYRAVWLDRDPKQQALSMAKFLRGVAGISFKRRDVKRIAKAFCEDRPKALAGLRGACEDVVTLRFEDILADPLIAAVELEALVDQELDVSAMARAVLPRDGACRPDLGIEAMLASTTATEKTMRRGCQP